MGKPTTETGTTSRQRLFSVLLGFGPHVGEVEVFASPTPPDPAAFAGWTIIDAGFGWFAIRGRQG